MIQADTYIFCDLFYLSLSLSPSLCYLLDITSPPRQLKAVVAILVFPVACPCRATVRKSRSESQLKRSKWLQYSRLRHLEGLSNHFPLPLPAECPKSIRKCVGMRVSLRASGSACVNARDCMRVGKSARGGWARVRVSLYYSMCISAPMCRCVCLKASVWLREKVSQWVSEWVSVRKESSDY